MVISEKTGAKYSVLMSLYKKENPEYLKAAIDSMINQTVPPDEIVIVEDGPLTDELYAVLSEYEKKCDLIKRVKLAENHGLGYALNEGLKACRNELVARMDTDDISLPFRCEKQLREFESDSELCLLSAHIDEFEGSPDNVTSTRYVPLTFKEMYEYSKRRSAINHPVAMYKKSAVFSVGGYPTDLKRCEDFELFGKMLFNGIKSKNMDESLLLFRIPEDKLAKSKRNANAKFAVKVIKRFYKWGYASLWDYLFVKFVYAVVGLIPIKLRKKFFKKFLRKKA